MARYMKKYANKGIRRFKRKMVRRSLKRKSVRRSMGRRVPYKRFNRSNIFKRNVRVKPKNYVAGRQRKEHSQLSLAVASNVLGSYVQKESIAFFNGKSFLPDELAIFGRVLEKRSLSHIKAIKQLCPVELFKMPNRALGIDVNTTNPQIHVQKTTVRFTDNSSTQAHLLSFYEPLVLSLTSMFGLDQLLGLTNNEAVEFIEDALSHSLIVFYTREQINGNLGIRFEYGTPLFYLNNNAEFPLGHEIVRRNLSNILQQYILDIIIDQDEFNLTNIAMWVNTTDRDNIDIFFGVVQLPGAQLIANPQQWNVGLGLNIQAVFAGQAGGNNQDMVGQRNQLPVPAQNNLRFFLTCTRTCTVELKTHFAGFIADILTVNYAQVGLVPNRADSALAVYVKQLSNRRADMIAEARHYDWLLTNKVITLRQIDTKVGLKYVPKAISNCHFLVLQEGAHLKISTQFYRDYSGFMSLFKNVTRARFLQRELTDDGLRFYKRLEPMYNLAPIPVQIRIPNPDIVY